ncbi:ABC transporter B family member 2 [Hibiscus syriacus]|uniref:ABC transporter B family member 2 n=1 Tax=Hibiscus syriacus TaxID=106335 RepID=A0A6A2WH34_HIBSY|nr:ABC transporter B family member 2 [Hibiscus syriacus]
MSPLSDFYFQQNPSILLLDEATSALDAESVKCVQGALDHVMVGRTTVVVAHRLSTIRNAYVIVVVQSGKIVETGSHDELISNPNSAYSSLIQLQETASLQRYPSHNHTMSMPLRYRDWCYGVFGTVAALIARAQMHLFALGVSQVLASYYMDWETMCREVKRVSVLFCCDAVITIIVQGIEHLCFSIMGERLTLRTEIGWFDDLNNSSSMLASRLESDATFLKAVVVDRSTILIQNLGLIVVAFIIAFILNWRITLVILATFPSIISGHISESLFLQGYGSNLSKAYLKANMLAGEAVSNIRTVAVFSAEEKIIDLCPHELVEPSKRSFKRGQIAWIFYDISQFFIFSSYGLALWYGSVLMGKELASFKSHQCFEIMDRKTQVTGDAGEELTNVQGKSMALVGQSGSGKCRFLLLYFDSKIQQLGRDIRKLKLSFAW